MSLHFDRMIEPMWANCYPEDWQIYAITIAIIFFTIGIITHYAWRKYQIEKAEKEAKKGGAKE